MLDTAILIAFVIIPVFFVIISILIGLKRNAYQSIIKLLFTVLAVVISGVVAKTAATTIINALLANYNDPAAADIVQYLNTANSARDIISLAKALIIPVIFLASFIVIKFIFFILNLIPGFLLSDKAISRRQKTTEKVSVPAEEADIIDTYYDNNDDTNFKNYAPYKSAGQKTLSKIVSVICCMLSTFIVLASLSLPISAYAKYASTVINETESLIELDESLEEYKNIVLTINAHPTNKCYSVVNDMTLRTLQTFVNHKGATVSLSDAISSVLSVLNTVTNWNIENLTSQDIHNLADIIENDPFAKDFVTAFVAELCDAWGRGESYLGITPPDLSNPIMAAFLKELSVVDDITKVLRTAADVLKMKDSLQIYNGEFNIESIEALAKGIFESITPESVDMLKGLLTEDVISEYVDLPPEVAGYVTEFTGFVLDGIVDLKNNPDFSIDETIQMIEKEAEALSVIVEMVSDPENIEPEKIVEVIVESEIISDTVQKITDSGVVTDPYQIADMIPDEYTEQIKDTLDGHGITADNDMYKSIMAFIGK